MYTFFFTDSDSGASDLSPWQQSDRIWCNSNAHEINFTVEHQVYQKLQRSPVISVLRWIFIILLDLLTICLWRDHDWSKRVGHTNTHTFVPVQQPKYSCRSDSNFHTFRQYVWGFNKRNEQPFYKTDKIHYRHLNDTVLECFVLVAFVYLFPPLEYLVL